MESDGKCVSREFTVTENLAIVAERIKYKQSIFLSNLYTTQYTHLQI